MAENGGIVAHVFLVRGSAILLVRRAATGYEDGNYGPPGGHLEAHESVFRAAVRECCEEVGVVLNPTDLHVVGVSHYETKAGHGIDFFLSATRWEGEPHPRKECDHTLWCELNALPSNTLSFIRRAIERHLLTSIWFDEIGWE
jgi:8-oxo-dGTP diphosphatase